jgi:uncharacterized membrane protein YraQ (UPF0718 family)
MNEYAIIIGVAAVIMAGLVGLFVRMTRGQTISSEEHRVIKVEQVRIGDKVAEIEVRVRILEEK